MQAAGYILLGQKGLVSVLASKIMSKHVESPIFWALSGLNLKKVLGLIWALNLKAKLYILFLSDCYSPILPFYHYSVVM